MSWSISSTTPLLASLRVTNAAISLVKPTALAIATGHSASRRNEFVLGVAHCDDFVSRHSELAQRKLQPSTRIALRMGRPGLLSVSVCADNQALDPVLKWVRD